MTSRRHSQGEEMTLEQFNASRSSRMRESTLQGIVRSVALRCGYLYYHTHDSRRSDPGFLDTELLSNPREWPVEKPLRQMWIELKTETGKLTEDQELRIEALTLMGREVYVWRPSDWFSGEIERVVAGGGQ